MEQHPRYSKSLLWILTLVTIGYLGGCATLSSKRVPREPSYSYKYLDTSLSRAYEKELAAHPGQSGFLLLGSGMDAFAARTALFAKAEKSIDVQYFTVHHDMAGELFFQALLKAADRGVRVRILLDDVLAYKIDKRLAVLEQHPHIEIRSFNPLSRNMPRFIQYIFQFGKYSRRMHNKSVIVDNAVTILGSRNIGDKYAGVSHRQSDIIFSGLDVLGVGPVVKLVSDSFDQYWNNRHSIRVGNLTTPANMSIQDAIKDGKDEQLAKRYQTFLNTSPLNRQIRDNSLKLQWGRARLIADSPEKITQRKERKGYMKTMGLAQDVTGTDQELWIVSPYMVPGGSDGMDFFRDMRRRGIRITLITNSFASTDNKLTNAQYANYRKELLTMGVEIFEFKANGNGATCCRKIRRLFSRKFRSGLHAKIISFDRGKTYIGSMNMDPRSIYENTELGIVIASPQLNRAITDWFDGNLHGVAYRVKLRNNGQLVWDDLEAQMVKTAEPDTSIFGRLVMRFLSILPGEHLL